jgi:hypothetical protein
MILRSPAKLWTITQGIWKTIAFETAMTKISNRILLLLYGLKIKYMKLTKDNVREWKAAFGKYFLENYQIDGYENTLDDECFLELYEGIRSKKQRLQKFHIGSHD